MIEKSYPIKENKSYDYSYLLLKPDSKVYINEIEELISENNFKILAKYLITDFYNISKNLYVEKESKHYELVDNHLKYISYLFGNEGLFYLVNKDSDKKSLINELLDLKVLIRNKYSFTHNIGGYLTVNNKLSHLNLVHSPESINYSDRDLNYLLNSESVKELSSEEVKLIRKYRSYNI